MIFLFGDRLNHELSKLIGGYSLRKVGDIPQFSLKLKRLLYYRLDQNARLLISKLLYSLEINFPKEEDNKDIIKLLNAYNSIINKLFIERNEKELEELHNLIVDCFILMTSNLPPITILELSAVFIVT